MSTKLSPYSTIFVSLLLLLSACSPYQTSGVTPVPSRLVSVTTRTGLVLVFDSLPVARVVGDTVYGRQNGAPCAIPASDIAETRWMARPGDPEAPAAIADHVRLTPVDMAGVAPGAYVRVTAPSLGWYGKTGTLTEARSDTLLVRTRGILFRADRVPASAITELEVSPNHSGHALAVGAGELIGGTLGVFAGYALRSPCETKSGLDFSCMFNGVGESLLGAVVGVGLGALLGSAVVPEQWTSAGLRGARVGLLATPDGRVGLGLSLAF
jgi:hypothetical protein